MTTTIKTRASILSIRKEVTDGVPLLASASGDFVALQDGFSFSPETDLIESKELRNSLGSAKPRLGIERANAKFDHYMRHSGVEGQAPNFGVLLESLFGGRAVESVEHVTVASSTTTALKVASGIGAAKRVGQAVLIKDSVNGRNIRNITAITAGASDTLDLNFALANAPGSGVKLGKNVGYYPTESGHPSLTLDLFRGNGGAREVVAGAKVQDLTVDITAGQDINGSYTMKGTKYYFDAIEITTAKFLDFNDGSTDYSVSVTSQVYRDPHDLAQALQDAMNDAGSTDTFTVTYHDYGSLAGKFTISTSGSTLTLKWNTGTNTANTIGTVLGYVVASDDSGSASYDSDTAQSWASAITPSYDIGDFQVAKYAEAFLGGVNDNVNPCIRTVSIKPVNDLQEKPCISAPTGIDGVEVNKRSATIEITATMDQNDARMFAAYRLGTNVAFMLNYGERTGGNWQAGNCVNFNFPTTTVTAFESDDDNGDVVVKITLSVYVNSNGDEEMFLNFV